MSETTVQTPPRAHLVLKTVVKPKVDNNVISCPRKMERKCTRIINFVLNAYRMRRILVNHLGLGQKNVD